MVEIDNDGQVLVQSSSKFPDRLFNWFSNSKKYLVPALMLLLVVGVGFGAHAVKKKRELKASASSVALSSVERGKPGDLWADVVIGQIDFNQMAINEVAPFKLFNPGGVVVDRSVKPNRIYVYDGGNNRILGHSYLGTCNKNGVLRNCTSNSECEDSKCQLIDKKPADLVLGQPGLYGYSACNGDSNNEYYPARKKASSGSLCLLPGVLPSPLEGGSSASMAVDSNGNLFVPDFYNNRVLKFNSPFTTDTVADEVWGQNDFTGNECNGGGGDASPTSGTLCMGFNQAFQDSFQAGVEIDKTGNLWVADSSNHRVLRFPVNDSGEISKTADLVLGQQRFSTRTRGTGLNQMNEPAAVRFSPEGDLYVVEKGHELENTGRITIFKPPFTSGMSASSTFGTGIKGPLSIEFDPSGDGVWILERFNQMLTHWNREGTAVDKVLFKDSLQQNLQCGSVTPNLQCVNPDKDGNCSSNMCEAYGSFGFDTDGNIFVSASSSWQDVWRFPAPIPTIHPGFIYSADKKLFSPPEGLNYRSNKGLDSPHAVMVKNNQFIVADSYRLLFWNDAKTLSSGQPANGYAGISGFEDRDPWGIGMITADSNHMFVVRKSTVDVYDLPLVSGAQPVTRGVISSERPLPVLGGGEIKWGFNDDFWGIDVTSDGKYLWLTQASDNTHRVIRVRDPLTSPVVDVILGQANATDASCNRDPALNNYSGTAEPTGAATNTVCKPGGVTLDRLGNVWVNDNSLEFHGNKRILMFDKNMFDGITDRALMGPDATLVSPKVAAWKPAFNSRNQMAIGYNVWGTWPPFPGLYTDPVQTLKTSINPDYKLRDFYSQPYSAVFDEDDNLYIPDLNRGRVLIYYKPFDYIPPVSTPTPLVSVVPTPTVVLTPPVPSPTRMLTPGPSPATTITSTPPVQPVIDGFVPNSAKPGAEIKIVGSGFRHGPVMVIMNLDQAKTIIVNDRSITVQVPRGATTGYVSVTNANGTARSKAKFKVLK